MLATNGLRDLDIHLHFKNINEAYNINVIFLNKNNKSNVRLLFININK